MEQLNSHWSDVNEIWRLSIFRNSGEGVQVSLKSDINNSYTTWKHTYIYLKNHAELFLEREIFQPVIEKIKE